MSTTCFILSITRSTYQELLASRNIEIANHDDLTLDHGIPVLIYLRDTKEIIAEYEIDHVQSQNTVTTIRLEPIYNSPSGVHLSDLVLLTLTSHSLEDWKIKLSSEIVPITDRDFDELISRLKG